MRNDTLVWCVCCVSIIMLSLGCVAAACTADGELDPTFGVGGKVISDLTGQAYAVALQADGKIVVLGDSGDRVTGYYPAIVRYNADGTLDTIFGTAGTGEVIIAGVKIPIDGARRRALTIQADGKIVVAANAIMTPDTMTTGTTSEMPPLREFLDIVVLRYLPDGTPDLAFGQGGRVTTDLSNRSDDFATGIALQPDGKIVVTGFVDTLNNRDFAVVRYYPDGVLDQSFGANGIVITDLGSSFDEATAVAVQPDGKILVAGVIEQNMSGYDFAVVRYNSDGTVDTTFGKEKTGKLTTGTLYSDKAKAIGIQSDGKIAVAGFSGNSGFTVVHYNSDGSLDTTFGAEGKVTTTFVDSQYGFGETVVLQPDGKFVVAGYIYFSNIHSNIALARYNMDGNLDITFGCEGTVTTDLTGKAEMAYAAALQSDGKIIVIGSAYAGTDVHFVVVRYCGQRPVSNTGQ